MFQIHRKFDRDLAYRLLALPLSSLHWENVEGNS